MDYYLSGSPQLGFLKSVDGRAPHQLDANYIGWFNTELFFNVKQNVKLDDSSLIFFRIVFP